MTLYQKVDEHPGPNDHYFEHQWKGKTICFFVEITDERLTRAEWEATIDYEAAAKVDYEQRGRVVGVTPVEWEDVREELKERYRKRAKATVDAAVKGET